MLEKAEGGIALAQDAGLLETADAPGELEGATVLGDDQAAGAEEWGGAEEAENAIVLILFGVGRVDEDEIEWGVCGLVAGGWVFEGAEGVVQWNVCAVLVVGGCWVVRVEVAGGDGD